jgi:hypothetical protein
MVRKSGNRGASNASGFGQKIRHLSGIQPSLPFGALGEQFLAAVIEGALQCDDKRNSLQGKYLCITASYPGLELNAFAKLARAR